jgi:hypothetical protein
VLSECSRGERMVEVLHAVGKDVLAKARTF